MFSHQTARADKVIVFQETFSGCNTQGGRDGNFGIGSGTPIFDKDGWVASNDTKIYGAKQCIKFGTGSTNGIATTPTISFEGTPLAELTFSAAGWGDSDKNTLTISVSNGNVAGDVSIELENSVWNEYSCIISGTSSFTITFTGKRGFLDDVVVKHITTVDAPEMTESCTFWPNTTETPSKNITITPSLGTTARYTTDGSTPSTTHGTEVLQTTNFSVHATTTVKAIAYVGNVASEVVTKTYTLGTTVDGISAFCDEADGTETRLYLAADGSHETRVLYYDESRHQLFLRENEKALCVDFGTTAAFNPTPAYNQHVAGWVVGKKATENGLPKLVATANTTTDFLVIANPVTESQTQPRSISKKGELEHYVADWVTITDQRVGENSVPVSDRFGLSAYDNALADLSGIVIAAGPELITPQIAPITQNGIPGVVYVVDEDKDFYLPESTIENATVRLKRTLSKDYWNTFAVPFEISGANAFDAIIREFDAVDGNTMVFKAASKIEAGVPYLVKPTEDIVNPVYSNVTLDYQPEKGIVRGDYKFVATYDPLKLATDKTQLFLTTAGKLAYPSTDEQATIKGMRAYFVVPQNASPSLILDDTASGIIEVIGTAEADRNDVYNLNGQRITQPGKGLYIVNGKKLIIH